MTAPVVTIPDSPEGFQDVLSDSAKLNDVIAAGQLGEFITAYGKSAMNRDKQLGEQIQEQVQRELMNLWKTNGGEGKPPVDISALGEPTGVITAGKKHTIINNGQQLKVCSQYSGTAAGAGLNTDFSNTWEYFRAILASTSAGAQFKNRSELVAKLEKSISILNSFGSTVPADGGFLIPETMRAQLLMVSLESSVVRPRATVIPMDSLRVPIPAVDSTSNVSSIFGGITASWTEEAALLTESQASFQRVVLDAKKLAAYAAIPNELLADAAAFMGFFDTLFPQALAWFEDVAFFNGTGVGEPLGFMNAPAIVAQGTESGQATKTVLWENVVKMFSRMLPSSLNNAVWIVAPDVFPELATMALSVGTGGSAVWLNNGVSGPPASILGRPVIISEKAKTVGTQGDISFVDLSYYLIGDRQVMQAMESEHYLFGNDKTAFRVIERLDGRPWLQTAITPQNNSSNTLSPFVQLAAR